MGSAASSMHCGRAAHAPEAGAAAASSTSSRSTVHPLHLAAWQHDAGRVAALLAAGADAQAVDCDGWTATHYAVRGRCPRCLSHLLAAGAPVGEPASSAQQTPLHWAAAGGEAVLTAALLTAGADACRADASGRTALQLAQAHLATLEALEARAPYQTPSGKLESALAAVRLLSAAEARQRTAAAAQAASGEAGAAAGAAASLSRAGSAAPPAPRTPPHACSLASAAASEDGSSSCGSSGLRECRVCLQEATGLRALIPCGHRATCGACTARLLRCHAGGAPADGGGQGWTGKPRCPVCRTPATGSLLVFDC